MNEFVNPATPGTVLSSKLMVADPNVLGSTVLGAALRSRFSQSSGKRNTLFWWMRHWDGVAQ
jgi:hypothetical protein